MTGALLHAGRRARIIAALGAALVGSAACAVIIDNGGSRRDGREGEITRVLEAQVAAWNQGDLEGFMDGYWRSPYLTFSSGGRVQRGWETTLERYRRTYGSDRESMGLLSFYGLEVSMLDDDAAWVFGNWLLQRQSREQRGVFTLVFRRIGGRWVIVHDHTSVSPGQ